jgi:hypothetical protein
MRSLAPKTAFDCEGKIPKCTRSSNPRDGVAVWFAHQTSNQATASPGCGFAEAANHGNKNQVVAFRSSRYAAKW